VMLVFRLLRRFPPEANLGVMKRHGPAAHFVRDE
jgi:hypothetical protein